MQTDDATRHGALFQDGMPSPSQGDSSTAPEPQSNGNANGNGRARSKPQARPGDGEDKTDRKLLNLPPVVGSCLQYANKSLPYRPFPPDLDEIRKKIFLMEEPLLLDSQQIADYWPHISNLYMRSSRPAENNNGTVIEAWECRIRRRVTMKGKNGHGQGLRQRQSKDELLGDIGECKVRLNLLSYTKHAVSQEACGPMGFGNCNCIPEWLYVERTIHTHGTNAQHTHTLDLLDVYKRSDGLMYFCKVKVEEGQYSYSAVLKWMKEKYGPISSQLQHLNKADVANVARFWRQRHKDVELRSEIVEETDEDRQRKETLDSIQNTSAEQLRKAMVEVCKVYPQAVDIIAPFMDKRPDDHDERKPIKSGYDLLLPPPGRPAKRKQACDPPDPPTPSNGPISNGPWMAPLPQAPGSYAPAVQSPQAPLPYSQSYPQASNATPTNSNNAVRGFRVSLPTPSTSSTPSTLGPNAACQAIMHGLPSSSTQQPQPPPPPYPVATPPNGPPIRFQQWPTPSVAQFSASNASPHTNGSQRFATNGTHPSHDRPSWAQPAAKRRALESPSARRPSGPAVPTPLPVQESVPDVEEQLRSELG